jgi:hypothetical protein
METFLILYTIAGIGLIWCFLDQICFIHRVYGIRNWLLEEFYYILSEIHKFFRL